MSRLRFLAVTIDVLGPRAFQWVLLESFDDVPGFEPIERSEVIFPTYGFAWKAGCAALESRLAQQG